MRPISGVEIPIESLNIVSLSLSLAGAWNPLIFPLFASKTCQIWIPREYSDRPDSVRAAEPLKSFVPPLRSRDNSRFASAQLAAQCCLLFDIWISRFRARGRTLPAENNAPFPARRLIRTRALLNSPRVATDYIALVLRRRVSCADECTTRTINGEQCGTRR